MPRFSANLSMLYPEHPFIERFAAAAADGFRAVEYVGAYDVAPTELRRILDAYRLTQALFNMPAGDWAAGERGIASHPDRRAEFRDAVETTIAYARATECTAVNCLAGILPDGLKREDAETVLVENLRYAAPRLGAAGVRLLVEPINPRDIPGFLINATSDYERIAARVADDNLYLQFDFYHVQVVEGDLLRRFERLLPRIAHVQVADNPGRHEPGSGEINYPNIFAAIDRLGYAGWVGAEYRPDGATSAGLGWYESWKNRA
jgi:hydroxypyruvate isomerase